MPVFNLGRQRPYPGPADPRLGASPHSFSLKLSHLLQAQRSINSGLEAWAGVTGWWQRQPLRRDGKAAFHYGRGLVRGRSIDVTNGSPNGALLEGEARKPSKSSNEGAASLFGRGALVTGAGRGIGRAIAQRLAALGATVLCVSRTQSELDETVRSADSRAFALALDISADGSAQAMVDALLTRVPSLDILVHCAGIMQTGSVEGMNLVDFDRAFRINVRAPYALTQAALPALKISRGQVLFVNSSIIRAANTAGRGTHAVTQSALKAFVNCLRDEVNADGVRVLSIVPGRTATPRQEQLFAAAGQPYRPELLLQPEDVAELACDALVLPRTAEATDLFVRPMQKSPL